MRFLADENIPLKAVRILRDLGLDIVPVASLRRGMSDEEVADVAQREGFVIITFDKDFGRMVFKQKRRVPGVVLLRVKPKSPDYIADVLKRLLLESPLGRDPRDSFLVVREDRAGRLIVAIRPMR